MKGCILIVLDGAGAGAPRNPAQRTRPADTLSLRGLSWNDPTRCSGRPFAGKLYGHRGNHCGLFSNRLSEGKLFLKRVDFIKLIIKMKNLGFLNCSASVK